MGVIVTFLTILDVFVAILIIALVLVQQSKKGGGLGTTFGGGGSDSLFGAHASTHLSKLTAIFATIFIIVTLSLAIITGRSYGKQGDSQLSALLEQPVTTTSANTVMNPVVEKVETTSVHAGREQSK
jgi:preprotein translocase subunit SecG